MKNEARISKIKKVDKIEEAWKEYYLMRWRNITAAEIERIEREGI